MLLQGAVYGNISLQHGITHNGSTQYGGMWPSAGQTLAFGFCPVLFEKQLCKTYRPLLASISYPLTSQR